MFASHCALRALTGSDEISLFQMLDAGNMGHPANCGPAGGGGGAGARVGVGVGREVVGWELGAGVALEEGDGIDDASGLTKPREGEAEGLALAVRSPFFWGVPVPRKARRPEPAIARINTVSAAHWRRRMTEAYGHSDAVALLCISQSRNSEAASRHAQLATEP